MTDWITEWLQQNKAEIDRLADTIFTHPETAGEETQSAAALENFLQKNGFSVSKNTAGLPTAFTAEKGKGEPRIAFLAEYDALPNLGQNPVAHCDPVPGNGHGCGHNLLGAGIAAAACALAYALEQENLLGQVVVYGCPEEEICRGKIVMANAHCFDRDDAAISWHPADKNQVSEEVFQAMTSRVFRFYGKSAHAAASPEMGRSALDAAELTNVAVNYLREHVPTDVRMHYVYTHAGDAEHQLFGADNIKNISEEWLQAVLRAQGQFVWDYHYTEYGSSVRVSHLIYDEQNWEQPLGIVSVYVNSDYLRYALNSIRLGNNTVVYLLDAKGNLLFPYETGASIPENVGETVTIAGSASGRSAFVMRRLSVNGFRIVGEARDFDALKEITAQRKTILLLALTALTISVLAALLLTYHISTPILALSNIMKKVGAGDFKVDVPVYKGHDEVAILYSNFKNMLEMRERLTEEVYGAKVREKEAELRTLQAQINPHFLYNTLDSINWMAVKYGADDIEEMVTDLSQMLRYSLNNGVNQLKVSEELTQIRCYLNIQQKRFSNSFSTSYEIDPEVLDYQVIKLLLQPLVENALQHGFDESGQTGKLMLRVKKKENNIEFSVLNNGNKMDLEKVKQALQLPEDAKPTSYGLRNVNDRLVKYYGAESGLQFSIEGDYSCARFTIPAQL